MLFWRAIKSLYVSQINLQHVTTTVENSKTKTQKRICSEVSVNSPGNPWSQSGRRKCSLSYGGKDLQKMESFKPGVKEWRGNGWWKWWVDGTDEVPLKELGDAELERLVRGWRREVDSRDEGKPGSICSGVAGPLAAWGGGQICRPFVLATSCVTSCYLRKERANIRYRPAPTQNWRTG